MLLLHWLMAVLTTPCPDRFYKTAQSFPDCLALDDPVSTARLGPIVGKSEKVEGPLAFRRLLSTWRPLELNQHRLFGVNGQTKTVEPLRQHIHDPAGLCFQRESHDKMIGKTRQKT